jgi:propanediol utilization protein
MDMEAKADGLVPATAGDPEPAPVHPAASAELIPVAVSGRHVHLCVATVERLFGRGRRLVPARAISQPGQFAAVETVSLAGPAGWLAHVRVVGPERAEDQVEISRTDEFTLGIDAPVRESGDLKATPGLRIEGPVGHIDLDHGVICSLRHIHMTPAAADRFGVVDGDFVDVRVGEHHRALTFGDVLIRVRADFHLEMHVDTDEANAAGIATGASAVLECVHPAGRVVGRR